MINFHELLSEFSHRVSKAKKGLVLTHSLADGDAAGSAIALKLSFPIFEIGIPDTPARTAKKIFSAMGVNCITSPPLANFDFVVVIDAAAPYMLGGLANKLTEAIVIDHHSYNKDWERFLYYTNPQKSSTAEVVYELLKNLNVKISKEIAKSIAYGIASDTAQLSLAKAETLRTLADLVEYGVKVQEIFEILNEKVIDISQRISILKGFYRLKYQHYKEFIVAGSVVSAHEAVVCTALVNLGVDVAFVGTQKKEEFRISGRLSSNALTLGLSLLEIFKEVAGDMGLESGGHTGAAGINGKGDVEAVLNALIEVACRKLKERL